MNSTDRWKGLNPVWTLWQGFTGIIVTNVVGK